MLKMENVTDSITTTNNGKRKWKIIIDRQMWSQQRHGSQHAVTNGKGELLGRRNRELQGRQNWDVQKVLGLTGSKFAQACRNVIIVGRNKSASTWSDTSYSAHVRFFLLSTT